MGRNTISIQFDAAQALAGLDQIASEMLSEVRPAAQAGAQVLYDEVKARVPVSSKVRKRKGKVIKPGALRDSIYQVFSKDNSDESRSTYHVSWNYRKAPHGHLVEFGTVNAPARPFLRPAYDAKQTEALDAARRRFVEGGQRVIASKS